MSHSGYFSYIRVSTQRQGQLGTSLTEQHAAITRYAERFDLQIIRQFEERETAAKLGRPVFLAMLNALRKGEARGLILHKIDRGARNLKDWADIGSLIDQGYEVHFANESLDLNSRGGRLSADIQAVVAADYIRNLREETRKGIRGRLKQGLFPFRARVGYLDMGGGRPKVPDPVQAPLVRRAFERYASGTVGLNSLVDEMNELGMRSKNGNKLSRNGLVCILKNPFYTGLIRLKASGEIFLGQHAPIVSKALFDTVQEVFAFKGVKKSIRHHFIFRRIIGCGSCERGLIAERQKGFVYYRCQSKQCPQKTIREDVVDYEVATVLKKLQFTEEEYNQILSEAERLLSIKAVQSKEVRRSLVAHTEAETRLAKLTDAYLDDLIDRALFMQKKNEIISEIQRTRQNALPDSADNIERVHEFKRFLELLKSPYLSYKSANPNEKYELVRNVVSNIVVDRKSVIIKLKKEFQAVYDRPSFPAGRSQRAASRTTSALVKRLFKLFDSGVEFIPVKNQPKPIRKFIKYPHCKLAGRSPAWKSTPP